MKKFLLILLSTAITSINAQKNQSFGNTYDRSTLETTEIDFGSVANFILFTGAGAVANTGVSTLTGDVGSNVGAIAGFGAPSVLNGTVESANAITAQAKTDLSAACVQLQNIPATITDHGGIFGSINGETIYPGVYAVAAAVAITGTLTLDAQGDPNAMFIFKITGALTSVAGTKVILANGASSDNVYWIAVGAVALAANTTMIGTAIGYPGAVSLGAGGVLDGRLYATVGAVAINSTLGAVPVTIPSYNYLGEYTSNGTPLYLENPSDVISVETQEMISNSLPESYPVPDYNPQYITSGYDTDIKIDAHADVWVTFVKEGAGYKNVLGYYTYDLDSPKNIAPTKDEITIIFPNVSALGSGGGLQVGDKVKIGTFEAGTGIGWVLLANAWSSNEQTVGDGLWKLYSNPNFNPESNKALKYHNVLLADPENERIILGFEDIRRDNPSCDQDFNDAIFYVTANPYEAINTNNFADIAEANVVTSANDGGLESNGDLASLIAKRNFKRDKEGNSFNKKDAQSKFSKTQLKSKTNTSSLIDYLPETGMYKTETAKVSSPTDLLGITNAKEIFSVDYYQGEKRISAVLATTTEGTIYDHSKIICDRLNNSSLEDIRTVETRGHQIISSKIKRATGEIEYSLSFSVKVDGTENELFSFWNIDQYPIGNYQNFQIWGSSFSQVFSIANFIIDKHINQTGLISNKVASVLPNVFVKSGSYSNGVLKLNIVNKTKETAILFDGNIAQTEVSKHNNVKSTFSLSGNYNEVLYIETGVLFDIGFSLQTSNSAQKDALYLADGPWGLDYLKEFATVDEFKIEVGERAYADDVYEVDRSASATGEVKGNINLFRHLLPGDQTLDVADYDFVDFSIMNNQAIEIVIMQEDDRAWENRLRYTIAANSEEKVFKIAFNDFKDAEGTTVDIANIKTIVFSVIGDYTNYIPFNIAIKNLSFTSQAVLSMDRFSTEKKAKLMNYPNPFTQSTTIKLPVNSEFIQIQVFDVIGRIVDYKKLDTDNSMNKVQYNAPNLKSGIYKYLLKDDKNKSHSGTFIVN
ncbi:ice-binding family protein [Polaribacter sp. IC073]|uniref:ice-binding family protein n=1 Tax=Polaribacter sp. IC073 TaxID=2508540 RepID=UPI0011BF67A2|nr:ice-binding family protein [Polaribacter sp. IC073]TXD49171.1 DUF3494 domain-containing protein [Polaribacter sp. IC073]